MLDAAEPSGSVLPVAPAQNLREDLERSNLGLCVPSGLDDVLRRGPWAKRNLLHTLQARDKPELAVARVGVVELFDVDETISDYVQARLLLHLSLRGYRKLFAPLHSSPRRDPEVVDTRLLMADKEEATVVFDDRAGGDAVMQVVRPNVRANATREAWCPGPAQDNGARDCPARGQGATPRGVAC